MLIRHALQACLHQGVFQLSFTVQMYRKTVGFAVLRFFSKSISYFSSLYNIGRI